MKPEASPSPVTLAPVSRRKLSDSVVEQLRAMIASGQLRPGDALPSEREMMARMGVGRPAVREALQQLHTQGLITISHGERSRVNALNPDLALHQIDDIASLLIAAEPGNLGHLRDARRLFETGLTRLAAAQTTPANIARLRELVAVQRAALGDTPAFMRADIDFHTALAAILGNPVITALSHAMLGWLFRHHNTLLHWSGHETVTLAEHEAITDALASRDGEQAAALMQKHLDRSERLYPQG